MDVDQEIAAIVALMRSRGHPYRQAHVQPGGVDRALALLEDEQGLLAQVALRDAADQVERWHARGINAVSRSDSRYPANLREISDGPALLFVSGELERGDRDGVAVVGSRRASPQGLRIATNTAGCLAEAGYPVISGLAAGVDAAAHLGALGRGGRTTAVIGSGLDHVYPPEHASLQQRLSREGAVVSQFWPETRPSRRTFPLRNKLIAGIASASVIVEATATSGTRILARAARELERAVLLHESLLGQSWARELAAEPGVHVVGSATEVIAVLEHAVDPRSLV